MFFFHLFGAFNFYQTTHRNPSVATLPDAPDAMDATSSATSVARRNDWGWWKILAIKMVKWGWLLTPLTNPYYNGSKTHRGFHKWLIYG